MSRILYLFSLRPILLGFFGMLISGLSFPLTGVIIVQNGLIPMRYMLMHGVILGGVLSIAFHLPLLLTVIVLNVALVLLMSLMKKDPHLNLSAISTALMVFTMALASLLSHAFDVPSKDTLELLWGSPFTLTEKDLLLLLFLALFLVLYLIRFFHPISMLFFDPEIAATSGVNVPLNQSVMLLVTALVISLSMKMLGALLIDALVILPVISAKKRARSLRGLFLLSASYGFVLSLLGYLLSLALNLPVSGLIAILSSLLYVISLLIEKLKGKTNEKN